MSLTAFAKRMFCRRHATRRFLKALNERSASSKRRYRILHPLHTPKEPIPYKQVPPDLQDILESTGHGARAHQDYQRQKLLDEAERQKRAEKQGPQKHEHGARTLLQSIVPLKSQSKAKEEAKTGDGANKDHGQPFNPSIAALVTGLGLGFAGSAFLYYFSGSYRIVRHSRDERESLAKKRKELFGTAAAKSETQEGTFSERRVWFEDTAKAYACFMPTTHRYLEKALAAVDVAVRANKTDEVDAAIRSCAAELQKLAAGGEADLMSGRAAWDAVYGHLELIGEVAEEARDIPQDIRQLVEKRLEVLKKIGTRVGRAERRAFEEEELAKSKAR